MTRRYPDEELLQILRDKRDELGRAPLASEVSQRVTIRNRFGSWRDALIRAGIDPTKPPKTIYSDEVLLEILREEFKKRGRPPKYYEVKQATTMQFRFGSWNKALEAAGLKVHYR